MGFRNTAESVVSTRDSAFSSACFPLHCVLQDCKCPAFSVVQSLHVLSEPLKEFLKTMTASEMSPGSTCPPNPAGSREALSPRTNQG